MEIIPGHRYEVRRATPGASKLLASHVPANIARRVAKRFATRSGEKVYLRDEDGPGWGEVVYP